MYDDEPKVIARCESCDELIYDDSAEAYIDTGSNYFCCLECAMNFYGIRQIEDFMTGDIGYEIRG